MLNLPVEFMSLMLPFVHLFSKRTFKSVQLLVVGAILAPGKRTITAILRVMGLSQEKHFQNYPKRPQPSCLVSSCCQSSPAQDAGKYLCSARTFNNGFRRYPNRVDEEKKSKLKVSIVTQYVPATVILLKRVDYDGLA